MNKKVYVDFDGTLADAKHDNEFKKRVKEEGMEKTMQWYNATKVSNLELNKVLIERLQQMKEKGIEIILWTNRGEAQKEMTVENLGKNAELFSEMQFRSGAKGKDSLDGFVFDNEEKYLACGKEGGELITF